MTQREPDTEDKLGSLVLACKPESHFAQLVRAHNGWFGGAGMWFVNFISGGYLWGMAVGFVAFAVHSWSGGAGQPMFKNVVAMRVLLIGLVVVGAVVTNWAHSWAWKKQRLELREHGIRYRPIFRRAWEEVAFDEMTGIQVGALAPVLSSLEKMHKATHATTHEAMDVGRRSTVIFRLRDGTEVTAKYVAMAFSPDELDRFWETTRELFPEIVIYRE